MTITAPGSPARPPAPTYRLFTPGDVNGFFGLMFDNLTVLSFLAFVLVTIFGFPQEVVFRQMFPGTALGVLFGNLVYSAMAIRLARRTGNPDVTAMPLGLDTPSTIGVAFTVLGPAYIMYTQQRHLPPQEAAQATWHLGMAVMVYMGVVKVACAFIGGWIQRIVPQAGLLGSLAGVGIALLGFLPILEIFRLPVVGALALGLILYTLVAGIRLPGNLPGVAVAVLLSTALYYTMHGILPADLVGGGGFTPPRGEFRFALPLPTLGFVDGLQDALAYLPLAIPFGVLTIVGGINVTESARVAGDDFNTRDILLTEAVATLVAGVCGGVAQSTPYIGQPAYKAMGSRVGYTLLTGVFVGLGGIFGYVSYIVDAIPAAALAPILVFVALDIMTQAFLACPLRHAPAVTFAYLPTIARVVWIQLGKIPGLDIARFFAAPDKPEPHLPELPTLYALGNGFIVTAMLWGAFVAHLIDRRVRAASFYVLLLAGLSFFGVIHSVDPEGRMYLPWTLPPHLASITYQFAAAYLCVATVLLVLSFTPESQEAPPDDFADDGYGPALEPAPIPEPEAPGPDAESRVDASSGAGAPGRSADPSGAGPGPGRGVELRGADPSGAGPGPGRGVELRGVDPSGAGSGPGRGVELRGSDGPTAPPARGAELKNGDRPRT